MFEHFSGKSTSEEEKDTNYTRREFSHNSFERSVKLPDTIKDDAVNAKYNDGILRFKLAKKEEDQKKETQGNRSLIDIP